LAFGCRLMCLAGRPYQTRFFPYRPRVSAILAESTKVSSETTLQEVWGGAWVRIVKSFAQEKSEDKKFADDSAGLYDVQIDAAKIVAFQYPADGFSHRSAHTALVLWYGGRQVIAGKPDHWRCCADSSLPRYARDAHRALAWSPIMLFGSMSAGETHIGIL